MCRLHTPVNPYMLDDIPTVVTPHEVEPMLRRALCGLLAVMLLVIAAASVAYVPDVLKISAIPDENPNELMRIYTPFAEYLGRQLGIKIQFMRVGDYASTVEGLAAKKRDLDWYGGGTFVPAVRRTHAHGARPALRRQHGEVTS